MFRVRRSHQGIEGWRGMRVALGSPLVGIGLGLFVGLVLWLGCP